VKCWPGKQQCHCEGSSNWQADTTALTLDSNTQQQLKSAVNIHRWYRWLASSSFAVALCSSDAPSAQQQSVVNSHRMQTPAAVLGNCLTVTLKIVATRSDIELMQSVSQVLASVDQYHTWPIELQPHTHHAHNRHLARLAELPTTKSTPKGLDMYSSVCNFRICSFPVSEWQH